MKLTKVKDAMDLLDQFEQSESFTKESYYGFLVMLISGEADIDYVITTIKEAI